MGPKHIHCKLCLKWHHRECNHCIGCKDYMVKVAYESCSIPRKWPNDTIAPLLEMATYGRMIESGDLYREIHLEWQCWTPVCPYYLQHPITVEQRADLNNAIRGMASDTSTGSLFRDYGQCYEETVLAEATSA